MSEYQLQHSTLLVQYSLFSLPDSIMVVREILALYVRVRILVGQQPAKKHPDRHRDV